MLSYLPLIFPNLISGSIVVSDCWRAYNNLEKEGYIHWKVNHSIEFVSYDDPRIHTNSIKGSWRQAKLRLPTQGYVCIMYPKVISAIGFNTFHALLKNISSHLTYSLSDTARRCLVGTWRSSHGFADAKFSAWTPSTKFWRTSPTSTIPSNGEVMVMLQNPSAPQQRRNSDWHYRQE